jgi:monoterpene epsilon-lactone hydrolase
VPAQEIPIPTSISAEAQAVLVARPPTPPLPGLDDLAGWRAEREAHTASVLAMIGAHADKSGGPRPRPRTAADDT